jgi:phosphoglycolate phosphatase
MPRFSGGEWRGAFAALLFDLDGTLLDTVRDIALALNRTLEEQGLDPLPEDSVRRMIGRGSPILIERAAAMRGCKLDPPGHAAMLERFFHHYDEVERSDAASARPFSGAADALHRLHGAGFRTAVVTNKHHRFATGLLDRLELAPFIDVVIGGDSCPRRKPDPLPLIAACERLGVPASAALMVGDSVNDVEAARAAGMPVACVSYGYNEGRDARTLDCDVLLDSLIELPPLLERMPQSSRA